MKEELLDLFSVSPLRMTSQEQLREKVFARLQSFLCTEGVSSRADLQSLTKNFRDSSCPKQPNSIESYVAYLEENIIPHSVNMASPRCMGHMTSATPTFLWALGDVIRALNQNLVKRDASKTLTLLERQTMAMMHRLVYGFPQHFYDDHIQKPSSTLGIMASGGTLSNITALWIARNACLGPTDAFKGIEDEGLQAALAHYGYDGAVIIGSSLTHYSIEKAAGILGLGAKSLIRIPVDQKNRIKVSALREAVAKYVSRRQCIIAIIGNAGTTESGSIDPLSAIADIAKERNVHFHIDAAWGAPLLFSRRHRHKLSGIQRADSVTADGHKQLYLPIGSSLLLLRDPQAARAIEKQTRYMLQKQSGDLGKRALDGSRPGTSLFLHAALHVVGAQGYEFLVDENIRKAQIMAHAIRERTEFELLADPETNIVLYRYIPQWLRLLPRKQKHSFSTEENAQLNRFNESLQKAQAEASRTFVSRTIMKNTSHGEGVPIAALRAVITNPLVEEEHLRMVLEDQAAIGAELESFGNLGYPVVSEYRITK